MRTHLPDSGVMDTRHKAMKHLFCLVLLFILLRLGILLTGVETVSHYDEVDLGTVARELGRGLTVPFQFFQLDAYSGEALVLGPAVLPFMKIFGESLFAVKMVPFFFSLLTLCAVFAFCRRYFSAKTALYSGALFVLAPQGFTQLSLVGMAGHSEAFFFGFLAVFCLYEFLYNGKKTGSLALFGFAAGFSVWFYYANAIMVLSCLLVFLIEDRRAFLRGLPVLIPSLCAGFSPWLLINLKNGFRGLELVRENITPPSLEQVMYFLRKPAKLLLMHLPGALITTPVFFIPRVVAAGAHYLLLLAVLVPFWIAQLKNRAFSSRMAIFTVYPAVFCAVFFLCYFDTARDIGFVGFRYLTPLIGMLLLAAGIRLTALNGGIFFTALLVLGFTGQASLMFQEPFARATVYRGYSYYQLGTRWHFNLPETFKNYDDFMKRTSAFEPAERRMILWGLSQMAILNFSGSLFEERAGTAKDLTVDTAILKEPAYFAPVVFEWYGVQRKFGPGESRREARRHYDEIAHARRKYYCKGWLWSHDQAAAFLDCPGCYEGRDFCYMEDQELAALYFSYLDDAAWQRRVQSLPSIRAGSKEQAYRGYGRALFLLDQLANPLNKQDRTLPRLQLSEAQAREVWWGAGWGIRERFREDRERAMDWIGRLPAGAKKDASEGLAAFERWYEL